MNIKLLIWLAMIGLALVLAACGADAPKVPEVRPIRTLIVDPKPLDDDRQAVGEIRARQESDLGFRVSGKLISRAVDAGVSVKKGELLARLDEQDFRNRVKAAEADVGSAEAVLVEASGAEGRLRQLLSTGTTTRSNYDAALRNLRSSEAKRESAKAALDLANDQLKYTELHADFDGIVTGIGAEPGQVVNTGQVVVRLANAAETDAVFAIAEKLRFEFVVKISGVVRDRPEGMVNEKLPTGKVEILGLSLEILNASLTPPFLPDEHQIINEDLNS